jgi:branched-chain amino acid transport system substrate-binding protein
VSDREIKIGQTMPLTGPAAWASAVGVAEKAYVRMINDQGGINGRKINLIAADDGYLPWRTGNETRKLVEVEHVAFMFGSIGTPTQLAVAHYLNERKIPQLFIESGAYRWGDYRATPYTMGGVRPSYRLAGRLYARQILREIPNAKICILYEDSDFGRDYAAGVRDVLGDRYAATVSEATYESTEPADRRAQGHRLPGPDRSHPPAARRAGDLEGQRARLEADVLHQQSLGLGPHGALALRDAGQRRSLVLDPCQGSE